MSAVPPLLVCALSATLVLAQPPSTSVIPLWPSSAIEMHPAPAEKANHIALILTTGSSYLVDWLNREGFSVFVLSRSGSFIGDPAVLIDVQRAIRMVRVHARYNADDWKIDPQRIGVMGFEFGEPAAGAAVRFHSGEQNAQLAIDQQSDRPDFAVLDWVGLDAVAAAKASRNVPPVFLAEDGDGETADGWHARFVDWITTLAKRACCGLLVEGPHGECLCH
jgi:hypothetical protein